MLQQLQAALLATARLSPGLDCGGERDALAETLSSFGETDWTTLVEQALTQGTASMLCWRFLDLGPGLVPPEIVSAAQTYLALRERAASQAMAELAVVLDGLAAEGIEALPFKGPVLGLQAYGGPTMREFRDLDILVRPEHASATLAVLNELEYRSDVTGLRPRRMSDYYHYNGHDILFAQGKLPFEPHWTLAPRTFAADLDTGAIFARAGSVDAPGGRRFPCFSPEDALLAAAVHGGKEQWSRLMWVADIGAMLQTHPTIDWVAVLSRAREAGCLRMTLLAAALASRLLGARLPDEVGRDIAGDRAIARLVERVRTNLFTAGTATPSVFTLTKFRWRIRERAADRLRYASRTLLVARVPHFRTLDLPDPLSFLYPVVRLGHDFLALPLWKTLNRKAH